MKPGASDIFPLFFVIWAILGIGGAIFFYGNRDAALKRKIFPYFLLLIGIAFVGFTFYMQGQVPIFMIVAVVAVLILNFRMTRFCDACGQMVVSRALFVTPKYCQKCGAKLSDKD